MTVALFIPCFVDQLFPGVGIAALQVLQRLGLEVHVPQDVACCGQPPANAGFERQGTAALRTFVNAFADCDRIVVPSGSCTLHVRAHAGSLGAAGTQVAQRTLELTTFLHDEVGPDAIAALGGVFPRRVALHVGCHALRGLGVACPSELQRPAFNKLRTLLETLEGISFAELRRPDECCGFGGTFAVTEPAVSTKMGRDRLRDYADARAEVVVSTDASCLMHLGSVARRTGTALPMLHVAEALAAGIGEQTPLPPAVRG